MILLRTQAMAPQTAAFAERLARESGHKLCVVVDERHGAVDVGTFDKISLTHASCREIGLHCPRDFAWRCGDYGLYFARKRYPQEPFIWVIDYDVRLAGGGFGELFELFAEADSVDLIVGDYRKAAPWWYWTHTMVADGWTVWRCLFPLVRLSGRAIDLLYARRQADAKVPLRRAYWPNDESFVASVLTRCGMRCADLNDFGSTLYDESTYSFARPIDGDSLPERSTPLRLFHPVLFGNDLRRKVERLAMRRRFRSGNWVVSRLAAQWVRRFRDDPESTQAKAAVLKAES